MIFITVGTSFPFNRLVRAIDESVGRGEIDSEIFGQVGKGGYHPQNFESTEKLNKEEFDDYFKKAKAVVAHAGMGTISMALEQDKPILIVPRMREYREIVNDHQLETAKHFEQLGYAIAVFEMKDLPEKINLLKSFKPVIRKNQVEKVSERIGAFLRHCLEEK